MPSQTFANSGPSLVGYTLDNGRIEFLSVLGLGAYGVVYLAVDLQHPTPVYLAVKCLLRVGLDTRQRHFQRREIALHQLASRHQNVVSLHKVIEEGDYVFVIMDFCDEGDLFGMITERQRYIGDDNLIRKVFLQIVDAVAYLHGMGIFHRDLKPENILCRRDGTKICIADFGLATSEQTSTDFGCGSTFYLSPECQGGLFERLSCYSTETNDIWALGVILVNLTCGRNPWRQACPSDETFRAYVHNPDFLRTILPISHATNHILKGLFSLEPKDRTPLAKLREQILAVETFTMTEEELRHAHSAARAAAAAVRPIPPPAPKVVAPVARPQSLINEFDMDEQMYYDARVHPADRAAAHYDASGSHVYIDQSIIDQIDFTEPSAPKSITAVMPAVSTFGAGVSAPAPVPIHIEAFDASDYPLIPSPSQSSSGDGDISLPPTPEFNPADKAQPPVDGQRAGWNVHLTTTPVNGKVVERPDLLHVNIISPLSPVHGEFSL